MRLALALCLSVIGSTAAAQQPISQSMAQCAGLTSALRDHVDTPSRVERIDHMIGVWTDAAVSEAQLEGRDDARSWVNGHAIEMYDTWSSKSALQVLRSREFKDWRDYCGALARSRGLDEKMNG